MTMGDRIKELRTALGLTQQDLADKIKVTKQHISKLESGKANPSEMLVKMLCHQFAVREEWLRNGEGAKKDYVETAKMKLRQVRDEETGEKPELAVSMLSSRSAILEDIEANVLPASPDIYTCPLVIEEETSVCIDMICSILLKWQEANEYDRIKFEGQFDFLFPNFRAAVHERRQAVTQALEEQGMRIPRHSKWQEALSREPGRPDQDPQPAAPRHEPARISLPVVGRAAAGLPIEMIEQREERLSVDSIRNGDFAVIAAGTSMVDAGINDGDRVVIRPQPTVENGEIALVAVEDGSTIKRFYLEGDCIRLVPANETMAEQVYSHEENIRVLGRVVKVLGKADA